MRVGIALYTVGLSSLFALGRISTDTVCVAAAIVFVAIALLELREEGKR